MAEYLITQSVDDDVDYIAANMREQDKQEIHYTSGAQPLEALARAYVDSRACYTVHVDGRPAMMVGTVPVSLLEQRGSIWMLGTPDFHRVRFGKHEFVLMWQVLSDLISPYRLVENYVYDGNKRSLKMLRFLGFEIGEPEPYGLHRKLFRHFSMRVH